jgi:putative transposase
VRLLVRPETVLRWHREMLARRHTHLTPEASRPATHAAVYPRHGMRLARENISWG